ncbi:winged helix-turn-helix transcriptional regulator [Streptomyces fuscigenes]|uniref:winged helix-turn-helix transcriptional regulator n=1 Tax=Streptomyces fuscigenes TaxID=1528880 RepID=UPI001F2D8517|nr:helix-turn-helix domain-containing protein [Streptomyces fuscigenes]MCF3961046.1 helix-turn-helix transcriptional regulator [Streptomyces fuscigenes]
MGLGKDYAQQQCSIARALEVVGERWTLLVVRDAFYGIRRYKDFLVHLGIPRAVLASRLQSLEQAGVLEKQRYQQSPPRDEYVLTEAGIALWPTLLSLGKWASGHLEGVDTPRSFLHVACGSELGAYGQCPACGDVVPAGDVLLTPRAGLDPDPENPVSRALLTPHRLLTPLEIDHTSVRVQQ